MCHGPWYWRTCYEGEGLTRGRGGGLCGVWGWRQLQLFRQEWIQEWLSGQLPDKADALDRRPAGQGRPRPLPA